MVSREPKRTSSLHENLQLLRAVTKSQAVNKTSIIVDATNYITELKQKIDRLNKDISCSRSHFHHEDPLPMVTVETLEKGFVINVFTENSCPGLLVSVLQTFEELGISVHEARVSCNDTFRLEAVGGENDGQVENIDAQVVKQAVLQAIKNCRTSCDCEQE